MADISGYSGRRCYSDSRVITLMHMTSRTKTKPSGVLPKFDVNRARIQQQARHMMPRGRRKMRVRKHNMVLNQQVTTKLPLLEQRRF